MWLLLGILLDGVVTLALGILIGMQWKPLPIFYVSLLALHGFVAGLCIIFMLAVMALERDAEAPAEVMPGRRRREPKVVPIFARPRLDQAA